MKILIIHNQILPVRDYGGVERIIWWLGKELDRLGHQVSYLLPAGSHCPFATVLVHDPAQTLNAQIPDDTDVVHLCFQSKEKIKKPYLMMYQYNFHPEDRFDINTVFCSADHAQRHGSSTFVYNAIDPEEYGPVDFNVKRSFLLFMGYAKRPEKNLKDCLTMARRTGNTLAVVGGKDKWYRRRPWVKYMGIIGGQKKNEILQQSKALLFPIRWHEPFGIVLIEALYFGMPVIGSPYGSVRELIPPEVGYLSDSVSDMEQAIGRLEEFDPHRCHEYVRERFTIARLTQDYLRLYERVLSGKTLNEKQPVNNGNFSRDSLLALRK
jgi:glycosyltransferase involved in cell wall biosynthesis